jgi:hypothetical protein
MKNVHILILSLLLLLTSCTEQKYTHIGQEIIDGKVSATKRGYSGRIAELPKLWVQTDKVTKEIEIPFEYEGRWKVGDSCLLIIQKYKEIQDEKHTRNTNTKTK